MNPCLLFGIYLFVFLPLPLYKVQSAQEDKRAASLFSHSFDTKIITLHTPPNNSKNDNL